LNSGSKQLPWTTVIFFGTSANGQRAVIIGPGCVCSRDANGCSGRGIGERIIAVKAVGRRHATGSVGGRARSIGRPSKGATGGRNKIGAIGSDSVSVKLVFNSE
jgi:hypothetical protein